MRETLSKRSQSRGKSTAAVRPSGSDSRSSLGKLKKASSSGAGSSSPKRAKAAAKKSKPKALAAGAKKALAVKAKAKKPAVVAKPKAKPTLTAKRPPLRAKAVAKAPAKVVAKPRLVVPVEQPAPEPKRAVSSAVLRAFEHAVRIFNRRQFAEAKPLFEDLHLRFPQEVEIIARAQTYIQVCNLKLARQPSSPRSADELYDRGVVALNIGDFTQARSFFEKALRLRPDEPHLLYSLAATHAQSGAYDQALDYLNRLIQIQPRYRTQAMNDSDFSGLREDKRFLDLLGLTSPFDLLEARR